MNGGKALLEFDQFLNLFMNIIFILPLSLWDPVVAFTLRYTYRSRFQRSTTGWHKNSSHCLRQPDHTQSWHRYSSTPLPWRRAPVMPQSSNPHSRQVITTKESLDAIPQYPAAEDPVTSASEPELRGLGPARHAELSSHWRHSAGWAGMVGPSWYTFPIRKNMYF